MAFAVTPKIITVSFDKQNQRRSFEGLFGKRYRVRVKRSQDHSVKCGIERSSSDGKKGGGGGGVSNSNYVVPLDNMANSSCITRPLAEILRDLNKRIPDTIVKHDRFIPWYHANRMLSFYAPGWCGEIRDVIFSDNGSVTVVYRLTVRGSDGEVSQPFPFLLFFQYFKFLSPFNCLFLILRFLTCWIPLRIISHSSFSSLSVSVNCQIALFHYQHVYLDFPLFLWKTPNPISLHNFSFKTVSNPFCGVQTLMIFIVSYAIISFKDKLWREIGRAHV